MSGDDRILAVLRASVIARALALPHATQNGLVPLTVVL